MQGLQRLLGLSDGDRAGEQHQGHEGGESEVGNGLGHGHEP